MMKVIIRYVINVILFKVLIFDIVMLVKFVYNFKIIIVYYLVNVLENKIFNYFIVY